MAWLALVASSLAWAYIPEYGLIASRIADLHGKGAYQIEQEITFRKEAEVYSAKETWLVLGENNLRVTIEGKGPLKGLLQGTIIFEGSQKSFIDGSNIRNTRASDDWVEPLFHFRSSKYFRSRLVNLKVTPVEALKDRAPLAHESAPQYEPPSFIRLSRTGGSVCWAIGMNPTAGDSPTVWIEQDQFVLRKYRSLNQSIVRADNYTKYADSFWYPQSLVYSYGNYMAQIHTVSVKSLGNISAGDSRFKIGSLVAGKDSLKLPDNEALREFYARFR